MTILFAAFAATMAQPAAAADPPVPRVEIAFPRLIERIRGRKPDGFTALYDALGVYLDGASDQEGRPVLVIYSDGVDSRSNAINRRVDFRLMRGDVNLVLEEGQLFDDQGELL